MQDQGHIGEGVVTSILDRIRATARVELVYGEERKIGDKTIIPVAAVAYTFGGGSGSGTSAPSTNGHGESQAGVGGGGAGAVRVQPVAVLEVTEDETRVVPVFDWSRIITTGLVVAGIYVALRAVFRRK